MKKEKYTKAQIEAGVKFLNNKHVDFAHDVDNELQKYTDGTQHKCNEHTVTISIDVNERIWTSGKQESWSNVKAKGVKVSSISLLTAIDETEGKDAYWSGGLNGNIFYDGSGKDGTWYDGKEISYEDKVKQGCYLINTIKTDDSDGQIYGDSVFIENTVAYMEKHCDYNEKVLEELLNFSYSEQGAQEDERVNLDVEMDGYFWIKCNDELVKFVAKEKVA